MLTLLFVFILISGAIFLISFLADISDKQFGLKTWYEKRRASHRFFRFLSQISPLRPWRYMVKLAFTYRKTTAAILLLIAIHSWLHFANPYAQYTFFELPYRTHVDKDGRIQYESVYKPVVLADPLSDFLGYYRSGFLIAQNTLIGGKPIDKPTANEIIREIHHKRFDPTKPYLISGDQFSVLYPRNLGVFYNQLLDPNTAHSQEEWENRQRIYLQSVLFAIDGLSVGNTPKTTLVPIAPRTFVTTRVHPGDYGSDAVYGTLYALDKLATESSSRDGTYHLQTQDAAKRILAERMPQLQHMVRTYRDTVFDTNSGFIKTGIHLSSARDGASRKSSFYDNVILWKTLGLASKLGIVSVDEHALSTYRERIKATYWHDSKGYYQNDMYDESFSSDWLIGYVTGFFDLANTEDAARTKRTIDYITSNRLADPLPIKYQIGRPKDMPVAIRIFVPSYGGDAIWSYWGAEYITLLANYAQLYDTQEYRDLAARYIEDYEKAIVRDGGFAETFNTDGQFLQAGIYKSIRITGWVVQFEHARDRMR